MEAGFLLSPACPHLVKAGKGSAAVETTSWSSVSSKCLQRAAPVSRCGRLGERTSLIGRPLYIKWVSGSKEEGANAVRVSVTAAFAGKRRACERRISGNGSSNAAPFLTQVALRLPAVFLLFRAALLHHYSRIGVALSAAGETSQVDNSEEGTRRAALQVEKESDARSSYNFILNKVRQVVEYWEACQVREIQGHPLLQQGGLGLALGLLTASLPGPSVAQSHLRSVVASLRANPTFMSALIAWAMAQSLKVVTTYAVERRFNWKMIMASGGMPSSHSALVIALTMSVALLHGLSGPLFPVCLGFSLIVMYDATGVRYHAGMQAEVLNVIVADLFQGHPVSEKKLKELLGHTPLQVAAGALLGGLVAYFYSNSSWAIVGS